MDSLEHGIEHLAIGETRDLKNAVLHVAHAVELFLKARLAAEHATLIFKEPSKAGDDDLTVDAKTCIDRLRAAGVKFEIRVEADLKSLRTFRNRIEHHRLMADKRSVTEAVGRGLRFLESFLDRELDLKLRDELGQKSYLTLLDAITTFEEKLRRVEEMIQEHAPREKDDPPCQRVMCPNCWTNSILIPDPRNLAADVTTCFFCGEICEVHDCERCGEAILDDSGYCDSCAAWSSEID